MAAQQQWLGISTRSFTALVRGYGLRQEFVTALCAAARHGRACHPYFEGTVHTPTTSETLQHASRVLGDWIHFYNRKRPPQALRMKIPAVAFALAA